MPDMPGRDDFEAQLARVIARQLASDRAQLMDYFEDEDELSEAAVPESFWDQHREELLAAVSATMVAAYMASARHIMEEFDYGVDEAELAQLSAQWARQHAGELVTGLTETSRNGLRELIGTAQEQGWSMGQVRDALTNVYGPVRAEMIAITETTRANIEGEAAIMQMLTDAGLRVQAIWRTAGDEAVCPICAPLDGLVQGEDWIDPPPAHPRCRCELEYEVRA